jgi:3-methyladenine DNA glycosylase AlkD
MTACNEILGKLHSLANPANVAGMARFGISSVNTLGISMKTLRTMSKEIGKNHTLAADLWATGIHEARILAALVDEPQKVTGKQMDAWVHEFDSWDVCDQCCSCLFDKTPYAYKKAFEWSTRKSEFVKRAGFVMMAVLAVHDKKASDSNFDPFLVRIEREADDDRNFVKKAVNWALRQIGKRSLVLNRRAAVLARNLIENRSPAARWIGTYALRELTHPQTVKRIKAKKANVSLT